MHSLQEPTECVGDYIVIRSDGEDVKNGPRIGGSPDTPSKNKLEAACKMRRASSDI